MEIEGIRAPFRFEGVIRQAIHQLKYNHFKALAPSLAQLMYEYLKAKPLPAEVLVPVPLHPHRLRERGYNQASLLAQELGKLTNMWVVDHCLVRLKDTPAQTRAAAEMRRSNVAEAFACQDQRVQQRRVLLIDDVCTTGSTLNSCAIALKKAGASSVWGLTIAREV
jgi:ComF family protein